MKLRDENVMAFVEQESDNMTAGDRYGIVLYRRDGEYVVHSYTRQLPDGDMTLFWGHYFHHDLMNAVYCYSNKRNDHVRYYGVADEVRIDDTGA